MKLSVSAYRAHASAHKKILSSSYQTQLNYGSTAASSSTPSTTGLFSVSKSYFFAVFLSKCVLSTYHTFSIIIIINSYFSFITWHIFSHLTKKLLLNTDIFFAHSIPNAFHLLFYSVLFNMRKNYHRLLLNTKLNLTFFLLLFFFNIRFG